MSDTPNWEKLYLELQTKYNDLKARYSNLLAVVSDGGLQMMVLAKTNALPPDPLPMTLEDIQKQLKNQS